MRRLRELRYRTREEDCVSLASKEKGPWISISADGCRVKSKSGTLPLELSLGTSEEPGSDFFAPFLRVFEGNIGKIS